MKNKTIHIAVYRGPATTEGCAEAVRDAVELTGSHYQVEFLGPDEASDVSEDSLSGYDLYVQPGGGQDIEEAFNSLGSAGARAIRSYVAEGGRYLGICMGAHLGDAANIGLIADTLDSEVGRPGFSVETIDDAAITVRWQERSESIFYQDGPYLFPQPEDDQFQVIATYENGDLAAARYSFEKGIVVMCGPHPEADDSWFEDADISLDKKPERNLFKDLLDHLGL